MSENIIPAVDPDLIEHELTPDRLLRHTNKAHNLIYVIDGRECPSTMREIGRLREIAFRAAGGGTGKALDIDDYDMMNPPCRQLIVWDPAEREILGGYRFIIGEDIRFNADGTPRIAMSHMFSFSPEFVKHCLPYTIELGRSFVRNEYQSSRAGSKALFVLDNLWDGLGALTVVYPSIRYLLGKVTMYPDYSRECRDMLLFFLHKHFPDPDRLVRPFRQIEMTTSREWLESLFTGGSFKDDYRILHHEIRARGCNIPPLVNAYMSLSPSMRMFGTAINDEFGDVEESGIFFAVSEITDEKKSRHILTFDE